MSCEKFKLKLAKYRVKEVFMFLICSCLVLGIVCLIKRNAVFSNSSFVFMSTILGAIVGGIFTLLGSLCIFNKTQKSQNAIKRNNSIFKPLFDELMDIHNNVLNDSPYPSMIYFRKMPPTAYKCPQYVVWGEIKNDSRLFEVPKKYIKAMDELYETIKAYQENRKKAVKALDKICKEEIKAIPGQEIADKAAIGDALLEDVMLNTRPDTARLSWSNNYLSDDEAAVLWDSIVKRTNENADINTLKEAKDAWIKAEERALELLKTKIQNINLQYER